MIQNQIHYVHDCRDFKIPSTYNRPMTRLRMKNSPQKFKYVNPFSQCCVFISKVDSPAIEIEF
jgi:hypothetical protein